MASTSSTQGTAFISPSAFDRDEKRTDSPQSPICVQCHQNRQNAPYYTCSLACGQEMRAFNAAGVCICETYNPHGLNTLPPKGQALAGHWGRHQGPQRSWPTIHSCKRAGGRELRACESTGGILDDKGFRELLSKPTVQKERILGVL
jgi:hypothetical protein